MIPLVTEPVTIRKIAAGAHTIAGPTSGSSDSIAMMTPQKTGARRPRTKNSRPPSSALRQPTRSVPFSVARVTLANRRKSVRWRPSPIGIASPSVSEQLRRRREERRTADRA